MRLPVRRFLVLAGAVALVSTGMAVATASAAARDTGSGTGLTARLFAAGASSVPPLTHPDDITAMGGSIFIAWQNNTSSTGEPAGSFSTVVEYSRSGHVRGSWDLTGRVDGMTADAGHERIVATVNEDGNTSLFSIRPEAEAGSQVTHNAYSPNPLPHGGGTDAPHIYRGQLLISASAPSGVDENGNPTTHQPAVYRATLSGTTATLTPVFYDDSTATVANTDSPQYGQQTTLALSDPDSNTVVPGSSPRFRGEFMLDSQGDAQQVYARNAGTAGQQLSVLNLRDSGGPQAVDDTAWATSSQGTLYVTDSADNQVWALSGRFKRGTAFSAAAPGNLNTPRPGSNYLATLDLNTGFLTPVPGQTVKAKGLLFLTGAGDNGGDNGDG